MNKSEINFNTLFLLLTLNLMSIFNANGATYRILGEVPEQYNGKQVLLFTFENEKVFSIDSTVVKDKIFSFAGIADSSKLAILTCGNYPEEIISARILLENGVIQTKLNKNSLVSGTPLNENYQLYLNKQRMISDSLKIANNIDVTDSIKQVEKDRKIEKFKIILSELEINLIRDNIKNELGITLIKEKYKNYNYEQLSKILEVADERTTTEPGIAKYAAWMKARTEFAQRQFNDMFQMKGQKFTDFTFLSIENKKVQLSDYIGKSDYVLLDFWASWCGPCVAAIPQIKTIYEKYHTKGFDVISISLDSDNGMWKSALKRNNMPWVQLCDLKGGDSGIKDTYKFLAIPYTVLLDKKGIIIVTGLHDDFMTQFIDEIFK